MPKSFLSGEGKDLVGNVFLIETVRDGKRIDFRGESPANAAQGSRQDFLTLKPGEKIETTFELHKTYSFWDRRTRYRMRYEKDAFKSNTVEFWF
ncbi:MAG: hypothetical protein HC902_14180 [Calothrix sp. SM1_5_4]|nr:hypothetical protein [Calothrix sp. SM1_5_4]